MIADENHSHDFRRPGCVGGRGGRAETEQEMFKYRNFGKKSLTAAAQNPLLLVLAVDLPNLKPDMLRKILARAGVGRGAIPRVNGNIEPLDAFYPKAVWQLCAQSLGGGFNSARDFAARCVASGLATFVDLPADDGIFFANCNSPGDAGLAIDAT